MDPETIALQKYSSYSMDQIKELFIALLPHLEVVGLGISFVGAIILFYESWVSRYGKKDEIIPNYVRGVKEKGKKWQRDKDGKVKEVEYTNHQKDYCGD